MVAQYQYKTLFIKKETSLPETDAFLNELGAEGWFVYFVDVKTFSSWLYMLRREVQYA